MAAAWQPRFEAREDCAAGIAGERPNSVYAVMSSASAANRLVIEIEVRHE